MKRALSALIHGPTKSGKSTLTFSAPLPLCALDAEGSTKFIRSAGFQSPRGLRKIVWNPTTEAPPIPDGTWDVAIVNVQDWQTLHMAAQHLTLSEHGFRSVSVDSVTEAQRKCKAALKGTEALQQQDWGRLLTEMDALIRGLRDLTLRPDNALEVALFVAETRMKDGKWRPYMQGAVETSMPYWVDLCGYIEQQELEDDNGQGSGSYQVTMLSRNHPNYEAGERVQGVLPRLIAQPNITDIINAIYA